jgi:hypothetical protein
VRRKRHSHPVPGADPYKIRDHRSGRMRNHAFIVFQTNPAGGMRKEFDHNRLHFHHSPYGRVRTHGPLSVTATLCSKCADGRPSLVTAVQRFGLIFISA